MIKLLTALVLALLTMPALAQDEGNGSTPKQAPNAATEKLQDTLDQPKPTEDGAKQAPQGEAKPDENWYGCKPDQEQQDAPCDSMDDDSSEQGGA